MLVVDLFCVDRREERNRLNLQAKTIYLIYELILQMIEVII